MDNGACSYRRYLEGDEAAFDELVKALFDNLVFFVERYVHDHQIAEDIAIDTFTELILHKKRYDFRVSMKTYLFMIGRCRALNYLKKKKRRDVVSLDDAAIGQGDSRAQDAFLQCEQNILVHRAIAVLPQDMQTAIHLIYFEDMTYEEVARIMKKSKKQVDNLLYRAKKQLREILEREGAFTT